jgi:hypothetical protein
MKHSSLIKIYSAIGLIACLIILAAVAHAVTTVNLNYPSFASSSGLADFVNKLYNWSLGIAGTLAVVMIVYGGIKYIVSAGNVGQQSDAKSIITNAIWGIVLLAGAYLILFTINPQLVNLSANEPGLTPIPAATSTTLNPVVSDRISDANKLIPRAAGSAGDCGPDRGKTGPTGVLFDVKNGNLPMVCSNGCTASGGCSPGGGGNINLNINMLDGLVGFFDCINGEQALVSCLGNSDILKSPPFKQLADGGSSMVYISSLTGGSHAANSRHYQGKAADLVVRSSDSSMWDAAVSILHEKFGADAWCENPNQSISEQRTSGDCEKNIFSGSNLVSGAHIHAQW